ncbi:MAG: hypothetical protein M0Z71_11230 [Nitrospiraceae bacterium]|nr:hypothetical protein [Nitrospiraceae bacterium]
MNRDVEYNVRTLIGLLVIAVGVAGCIFIAWWLSFEGDIIDIIHIVKMQLPGWMWIVLRIGLSGVAGILSLSIFVLLAIIIFSGGSRK